ncbi:hypothetical protein HHI36_004516 [Cryptolaemus montrouzieri]|uniref:C2H2-type domain-containing protein n=1 Tax=Cryptolaemus montrouzieri TaxID=559131 RepID=A0ABD2NRQ0_9CUCU
MVNNDADSVNCSTTQIRDEDEKVETSKSKKSDSASPGPETVVSSSRKSSLDVEKNSDTSVGCAEELESSSSATKTSLFCSVPLNKIRSVLSYGNSKAVEDESSLAKIKQVASRKLLCLYCDRTFVSTNLRQKHVERCHSEKQSRRLSSRKLQSQFTTTACFHCDKLPVEHSLTQLFEHLVTEHSQKYFGCLSCEERFLSQSLLSDHNAKYHASPQKRQKSTSVLKIQKEVNKDEETKETTNINEEDKGISQKLTRSMAREKTKPPQNKSSLRQLRSKKIAIKASKIGLKRSKRLRATQTKVPVRKKKRTKVVETTKLEETTTKTTEKAKANSINPYPEFDNYYRVKKITDHSIDNLKISSLTFDDVFDKAFFNRIKCNIQENLMFHLDGKLFKNEESESRISNFEKNPPTQDVPSTSSENFGCDLSLNAITPVTSILTPNFGEDLESQIEYGSKPSKKKLQTRQDPVRHKYVTRRKYQASILEHKENRDLSKLDMWTQLVIKDRQQKVMNDQKSAKEMLEYTTCAEYKLKVQRTELNRILDRRGPFEDLQEEASKKAALDKLNSETSGKVSEECFKEVRLVMETLLNEVVRICAEQEEESTKLEESESLIDKVNIPALPDYLQLRRTSAVPSEEIDKSDKIVLICSSQETENYELPTNKARAKNEMVELSGEWARSRIYVCAACGLKLPNMKLLLEHKSLYHQNAWVQHYELVGNQSELYRHLCIPGLGKVGHVEDTVQCKLWRRSDARVCSKCGKMCNALAELHRHILECGGDWTWMLARKKCKHRPFGSRKKRRGLVKRIRDVLIIKRLNKLKRRNIRKHLKVPGSVLVMKVVIKMFDFICCITADTIQRMLANLPPKRSSRKSICMKDGFPRNRNNKQNNKKKVMKCGKIVMQKSTYKTTQSKTKEASNNLKNASVKKTMRNLSRTLSSKILDTSSKLRVKRQLIKNINRRSTRRSAIEAAEISNDIIKDEEVDESNLNNTKKNINAGKSKIKIQTVLRIFLKRKSILKISFQFQNESQIRMSQRILPIQAILMKIKKLNLKLIKLPEMLLKID